MLINDSPLLDWAHHTPKHSPTVFLGRAARETIVRRDFQLVPLGTIQETITFGQIEAVKGQFVDKGYSYHYVLNATTFDGREIEIGRGPNQENNIVPHPEIASRAQAIADKSGARLELK